MPKFSTFRRCSSAAFVFLLGVFVTSIFSAVTIYAHGSNNLIRACVNKSSGEIHILLGNKKCKHNETTLDWNKQGPPGPAGPQGPSGSTTSKDTYIFTFKGIADSNISCGASWGYTTDCLDTELPIPKNGKLLSLTVNPYTNRNTTGGPAKITVFVNGMATSLEIQIPASSTSVVTVESEVIVHAKDLIRLQSNDPTGDGDTRFNAVLVYKPD